MPAVTRIGDADLAHCSGMVRAAGSGNVFANFIPVSRQGDVNTVHLLPGSPCPPHSAPIAVGSLTVGVNLRGIGRVGDAIAGCTAVAAGSPNVFSSDVNSVPVVLPGLIDGTAYVPKEEALLLRDWTNPENEGLEYGDGGIFNARRANTSPITGQTGPISTPAPEQAPFEQPSNEDGEYILWLPHVDSRVKPEVVENLENLSKIVGYQLQVTSGYRSPQYNASVGGAKKSQHMLGNATDIVQRGLTNQQRADFIQAAIDSGFTAIGVYNTFTHIDIRGAKVAWGSNGSRTTLPNYPWALEVLRANGYPY